MEQPPKLPRPRKPATPASTSRSESGFRLGCGISMGLALVLMVVVLFVAVGFIYVLKYYMEDTEKRESLAYQERQQAREKQDYHQLLLEELYGIPNALNDALANWHRKNPDASMPPDWLALNQLIQEKIWGLKSLPTEHFVNCLFIDASFNPRNHSFVGTMKFINRTGSDHAVIHFFSHNDPSKLYIE